VPFWPPTRTYWLLDATEKTKTPVMDVKIGVDAIKIAKVKTSADELEQSPDASGMFILFKTNASYTL